MGWNLRFWRRIRIAPGVSINLSKSGPSVSVGPRGAKVTVGREGIRQTLGIPGTGIYATKQESWGQLEGEDGRSTPEAQPGPATAQVVDTEPEPQPLVAQRAPAAARKPVQPCGFCGGQVGSDGRCRVCGQPAERWRGAE